MTGTHAENRKMATGSLSPKLVAQLTMVNYWVTTATIRARGDLTVQIIDNQQIRDGDAVTTMVLLQQKERNVQ